jgi:hypothetical protein
MVVEVDARPHARPWHGDQAYTSAMLHVLAAPERFSQGVRDDLGQGHPQSGRLCLRLYEQLIVDVNGRVYRLCPSWPVKTPNNR